LSQAVVLRERPLVGVRVLRERVVHLLSRLFVVRPSQKSIECPEAVVDVKGLGPLRARRGLLAARSHLAVSDQGATQVRPCSREIARSASLPDLFLDERGMCSQLEDAPGEHEGARYLPCPHGGKERRQELAHVAEER